MRILFIQPNRISDGIEGDLPAAPEPLALETLAATVPDEEVLLLDLGLEDDLEGTLSWFAPQLVAVTALGPERREVRRVLSMVQQRDARVFTVVLGLGEAPAPGLIGRDYPDAVCRGDINLSLALLVKALRGGHHLDGVPNLMWRDRSGRLVSNPGAAATPIVTG